jgi:hypothetical protein
MASDVGHNMPQYATWDQAESSQRFNTTQVLMHISELITPSQPHKCDNFLIFSITHRKLLIRHRMTWELVLDTPWLHYRDLSIRSDRITPIFFHLSQTSFRTIQLAHLGA